jgi:hypothetical protein
VRQTDDVLGHENLSCLFANDVKGPFIGAQPQKGWMPHLAFARPLGELYLAHELGNKPRGRFLVLHFLVEGLLVGAQRLHRSIERFEGRLVEASANVPRIDPALRGFVAYCKHERPKILARPAQLCITDDHHFLLVHGLEFEPLARSLARVVQSCRTLGDHTLFVSSLCLGEFALAELGDVLAVVQ